jgi:uncharacterized protein YcfJ
MPESDPRPLPSGRQPYDPLNGLRVGALSGGLMGAVATATTSAGYAWLVLVGAVAGGATGYWYERRRLRRDRETDQRGSGGAPPC